jgi:hypothetical protein
MFHTILNPEGGCKYNRRFPEISEAQGADGQRTVALQPAAVNEQDGTARKEEILLN